MFDGEGSRAIRRAGFERLPIFPSFPFFPPLYFTFEFRYLIETKLSLNSDPKARRPLATNMKAGSSGREDVERTLSLSLPFNSYSTSQLQKLQILLLS